MGARVRLTWCLLIHDKGRLLLSVAGIAFAVLLMFVEMGFLNGVFDSETLIINKLNADILVVSRLKDDCYTRRPFPRTRLRQVAGFQGVEAVDPVYMDYLPLKAVDNRKMQYVIVFAFDANDPVLLIPEVRRLADELKRPRSLLMESTCREYCFGTLETGMKVELRGRSFDIAGTFPLFPNYSTDGHVLMSDQSLLSLWADPEERLRRKNRVDFGLVKVQPGHSPAVLMEALRKALPGDVSLLGKRDMAARVEAMWRKTQPVVEVFGLGMAIGFVIGVIICYQILFTSVEDYRTEFATLKALGYKSSYLVKCVLEEALFLSLLSFFPGLAASVLFYSILQNLTGIMMRLTPVRIGSVFLLTVVMCMVSSLIAIRKVLRSDPAEVF